MKMSFTNLEFDQKVNKVWLTIVFKRYHTIHEDIQIYYKKKVLVHKKTQNFRTLIKNTWFVTII